MSESTGKPSKGKTILIVALVVLGLGVAGCIACGLGGYLWADRWIDDNKGRLEAVANESREEAAAFAQDHEQNACIEEGLRKGDACGPMSVVCETGARLFIRHCLDTAEPTPGLCDLVPPKTGIMQSVQWTLSTCGGLGRPDDQRCTRMLQAVQEHCHGM